MDFNSLGKPPSASRPTDPIAIFERLPNLPNTPNDLWRGQTEALQNWNASRAKSDVLVSLNTGAGKTLCGLLIAQSLVNEGVENVIYLCATIDLVNQTSAEAARLGIAHTTRTEGGFNNDLFESGRAFCVTTYHSVFNGLSAIRRRHFPGAIIFDDAHVAESIMRDCLTLRIEHQKNAQLFKDLVDLFREHFLSLGRSGAFDDAITGRLPGVVMASPNGVRERGDRINEILFRHRVADDNELKFSHASLRDKISQCAFFFTKGVCEISPPFLPTLAADVFERRVRRVYLSATLRFKTDLIRSFGRIPDVIIEPKNDAGNGERLIIFASGIFGGFGAPAARSISTGHKILVAVPSYEAAKSWESLGVPPARSEFSAKLSEFRRNDRGVFVLVSRVDGIDLPHDTCRVMVIDGLPSGLSLLEKYQWEFLRMRNAHASKLANRIVQLFGRINRGRNDYGVFIICGREMCAWLQNDRNISLLPDLLQAQVKLGQYVQEGMKISSLAKVSETIRTVLGRDEGWMNYYGNTINDREVDDDVRKRSDETERRMMAAAIAEANFAKHYWNGDYTSARSFLEKSVEETSRCDDALAGWHNIWIGACYNAEGDSESAMIEFRRARARLGTNLALPVYLSPSRDEEQPSGRLAESLFSILSLESEDSFARELRKWKERLQYISEGTSRQMEASYQSLGEIIGFVSSRPDNDDGTGPDVLWEDPAESLGFAFELKTDKTAPAVYSKKDIGQGHDHLEWVKKNKPGQKLLGLVFLGPDGKVDEAANPNNDMWQCDVDLGAEVSAKILSLLEDLRRQNRQRRLGLLNEASKSGAWALDRIAERFKRHRLASSLGDHN